MSPSWIWSDKITNERVARVGYNHFITNKGEWNNCFSKFSNRVLPPIFISTILQSVRQNLVHYFPYDVKLRLLAHSRSFLANQKARNAIAGAENLLKYYSYSFNYFFTLIFLVLSRACFLGRSVVIWNCELYCTCDNSNYYYLMRSSIPFSLPESPWRAPLTEPPTNSNGIVVPPNFTPALFFQAGTTKVIYAYHPEDPSSENSILGHTNKNRGSRSLLLLNSLEKVPTLPSDTQTFDILHDKVRMVSLWGFCT